MPYRDPELRRARDRERLRRQTMERRTAGLCIQCGQEPAAPGRAVCDRCAAKRRGAERARYARGKASGKKYGGRDPGAKRKSARAASRKRDRARRASGRCTRCGRRPPAEGGATCERCRAVKQDAERELYAARRAAGLCVRCGGQTSYGGSRCSPCAVLEDERGAPERKNARARRRYAERRVKGVCTDCNRPSQGASRCAPCAERSFARSDHFRGMPLYPPSFTVVDLATGEDYGTWDSWEEVVMCLAFAKLNRDQVEIVTDQCDLASIAAWE